MNESQRRYAMVVAYAVSKEYTAPWPYSRADLAQAALLDIVRTIQVRDDLRGNGWMSNRAHWSIRSEIKRLKQFGRTGGRGKVRFNPEVVHFGTDDAWLEAKASYDNHDMFEIESLIEMLPERERQVAWLVCLGYRTSEIASVLGTTKSNVSQRLASMRKRLEGRSKSAL